ncbi:MAG: aldo/keto reductase [Chloroflexota bacterium]
MADINAADSGTFMLGGDIEINRLGYGAMRITGQGIWGESNRVEENKRTLARLRDLNINFIDTADSYGPFVSEDMLREVLHPYGDMVIATKGGLTRHGPNIWLPVGRPEYLRQCVLMSMRRLNVEQIDLWQLHRIDPQVDRKAQFEEIAKMQDEGLIRHVGLSEVSVEEIEAASEFFTVASVQNLYNLVNRNSEEVLNYCEDNNIGFIPWFPLAAGQLTEHPELQKMDERLGTTPSQLALAWVLKRSPVMLPIPGTGSVAHLDENTAAASVELSDEDFATLDALGKAEWDASQN